MAIEVRVAGIDIAKNVFQVHGVDRRGTPADCYSAGPGPYHQVTCPAWLAFSSSLRNGFVFLNVQAAGHQDY